MYKALGVCGLAVAAVLLGGCVLVSVRDVEVDGEDLAFAGRPTGFLNMQTRADEEVQPAVLYVPPDYTPDREWPLIVFLHGKGERDSDGQKQTEVGIGRAIRLHPERFPALVFMPQCSRQTTWTGRGSSRAADPFLHIDDGIARILDRYNVDDDRISLTGLSMGGFGTFAYGAANIDTFSALMPVCGGGNPTDAAILAKRPMRVFHGGDDTVVAPERSRDMVEAIQREGGDVEYTEYPGVGHNSWDRAYGDADAIEWLLAQRRR